MVNEVTTTTTIVTTTTTTATTTIPKVSSPIYVLAPGSFETNSSILITIEAEATGADSIYYTTNGATPTASSTLYSSAFPITTSTSIQAIAVKTGYTTSDVSSAQ